MDNEAERDEEVGAASSSQSWLRAMSLRIGLQAAVEMPRRSLFIRLVLALALAIVLWVTVSAAEDPVRQVAFPNVPVLVTYPQGYYAVTGPSPVVVTVEGLSSDLKDLTRPTAYLDLSHVPSTSSKPLPVHISGLPATVRVVRVDPPTVSLRLDTALSRTVPVQVIPQGQPPPGYLAPVFSSNPSTVRITGPSHVVATIVGARVLIPQSTLTQSGSLVRSPQLYDSSGRGVSRRVVRIEPSDVTVTVHVSVPPLPQPLTVLPDITGTVSVGYRIADVAVIPSVVQVLSSKPVPATTTLTTAPIVVTGWTASRTLLAQLIVPAGLSLPRSQQATVTVVVTVVPVLGSGVTTAGVLVQGRRFGATVTFEPATVTVTYEGPLAVLNHAVAPYGLLNVRGLAPGVYHLRPAIVLARGLTLLALTPPRLRVVITAPPSPTAIPTPTSRPTATPPPTATSRPTATPRPTPTRRPTATVTPRPRRHTA